ncbi:MAG TPA: MOSC domain-containing protein [Anaerolineae bacterium]
MKITYLTTADLTQGLEHILQSPHDAGSLEMIVSRPAHGERRVCDECALDPETGVAGDHWARGCWKSLPDGKPDPDVQVTLMNARVISLIAQTRERWPLAGDNLIVDLDLSCENLPVGQRIAIGSAILQITAVPHTGCKDFAVRFGVDALQFVNSPQGKQMSLRGINTRILQAGVVRTGDRVQKIA